MKRIKLSTTYHRLLVIIKKRLGVIVVVALNLLVLGYLYQKLSTLQIQVSNLNQPLPPDQSVVQVDSEVVNQLTSDLQLTSEQVADLITRIEILESGSYLLGQTLTSCSIIPEAYSHFGPRRGYSSQLSSCAANYQRLQKSL